MARLLPLWLAMALHGRGLFNLVVREMRHELPRRCPGGEHDPFLLLCVQRMAFTPVLTVVGCCVWWYDGEVASYLVISALVVSMIPWGWRGCLRNHRRGGRFSLRQQRWQHPERHQGPRTLGCRGFKAYFQQPFLVRRPRLLAELKAPFRHSLSPDHIVGRFGRYGCALAAVGSRRCGSH